MRHKNLDQLIAMGIVVVSAVWILLPFRAPGVGIILALPLVFGLPGYTLTQALTYKRSLEPSHTLIFSLGLSLAIDVLSGFVLNLFPIGLQASSWMIFLGLLTTIFSLLTIYLRREIQVATRPRLLRLRFTVQECAMFGLAITIVILSMLNSVRGVVQQTHSYFTFTQLWLLPSNQSNNSCAVRLGIRSFEATPMRYSAVMIVNGTIVGTESFISLAPEQQWEKLIPIAVKAINDIHVSARLYRLDKPKTIYRMVSLALSIHDLKEGNGSRVRRCESS